MRLNIVMLVPLAKSREFVRGMIDLRQNPVLFADDHNHCQPSSEPALVVYAFFQD
jgi:hypothetical protein